VLQRSAPARIIHVASDAHRGAHKMMNTVDFNPTKHSAQEALREFILTCSCSLLDYGFQEHMRDQSTVRLLSALY
jgi:hypothetical protein